MEEWKDIEGYPNYMVSNLGRVKSLKFGKEKILKSRKNNDGYLYINLCKEGKKKTHTIHRLVAQAFLPNPNNLPEVNHKDEDKTNNRIENIEYCDRKYNINYGNRNEKMAKSLSKPILQFTKEMELVRKWESATDASRVLGINQGDICSCLKGKLKSVGGFIWGYEKDYEKILFKVFDLEIYRKIA